MIVPEFIYQKHVVWALERQTTKNKMFFVHYIGHGTAFVNKD